MTASHSSLGRDFAYALLSKDWTRLAGLLDDEIDFRGLTPGRPWEATNAKDLIETVFAEWLEPTDDVYEILEVATDQIADRQRVVYRFRVRNPDDDYLCEQTAYFDEADGKIERLRILCTGFLPTR